MGEYGNPSTIILQLFQLFHVTIYTGATTGDVVIVSLIN